MQVCRFLAKNEIVLYSLTLIWGLTLLWTLHWKVAWPPTGTVSFWGSGPINVAVVVILPVNKIDNKDRKWLISTVKYHYKNHMADCQMTIFPLWDKLSK